MQIKRMEKKLDGYEKATSYTEQILKATSCKTTTVRPTTTYL